jgi:DNA-binding transcriptional regulator YdaS (Cro superfamily)
MPELSEERIAELIALMAPPPPSWIQAAVELPSARAAIDELIARATADQQLRQAILADLEEALRGAGVEPRPELQESLRARLSGLD